MAQNFWTAIFSWTTCFAVTILVSVLTRPRADEELRGLVYSLTERLAEEATEWYKRPLGIGAIVLFLSLLLNIIFW